MAILNIETLKMIIENVPDDFDIEFNDGKKTHQIEDKIEVDVSGKKLVFKTF